MLRELDACSSSCEQIEEEQAECNNQQRVNQTAADVSNKPK
jgi:hypothetical protein